MSKVRMEFDTKEKNLNVTLDGNVLSNITDVSLVRFSTDEDEPFFLEITSRDKDEDNEMIKVTKIIANMFGKVDVQENNKSIHREQLSKLLTTYL